MCEFCTKHGDGKVWYRNAANYGNDLLADISRRKYIREFLNSTISDGFRTLGRLEAIFLKKGHLPSTIIRAMEEKARVEHFGQILPIEEIRDIVLRADSIVRMPCACRWTISRREERCCYALSYTPDAWYKGFDMSYFGKSSDDGLEPVGAAEAVRQMEVMEDSGAIHSIWTMMTPFIGAVCNCTAVDCMGLRTLSGIGAHTMARAEHVAVVDRTLCVGCGLCMERCWFRAVGSVRDDGGQFAVIDSDKCYGCGLCRRACAKKAISLITREG
jgi:NAD-dependent dihydropyrimidine dehydrogenase PreA subunit